MRLNRIIPFYSPRRAAGMYTDLRGLGDDGSDDSGVTVTTSDGTVLNSTGDSSSIVSSLAPILTAAGAAYTQSVLLKVNAQRLAAGLPPVDASALGLGVNVGLSQSLQQLLMLGGVAAIAVWFLHNTANGTYSGR